MSVWLILAGLVSAHAARPKLFAILNDRFSVHETRARVEGPAPSDLDGLTADWPLDPARSRELEDALEREFERRLLTSTNNHAWTGFMPYVVVRIVVDQGDIDRFWRDVRGKSRRLIHAQMTLLHTRTGTVTDAIPLVYALKRRNAEDPAPKLRLIEVGTYNAHKTPAENAEVLEVVLNDAFHVCAEELKLAP